MTRYRSVRLPIERELARQEYRGLLVESENLSRELKQEEKRSKSYYSQGLSDQYLCNLRLMRTCRESFPDVLIITLSLIEERSDSGATTVKIQVISACLI